MPDDGAQSQWLSRAPFQLCLGWKHSVLLFSDSTGVDDALQIVGLDSFSDLAVLQIDVPPEELTPIKVHIAPDLMPSAKHRCKA